MKLSRIIESFVLMVVCLNHLSVMAYETGNVVVEISLPDSAGQGFIGDGGSITVAVIGASATAIVISVSQDFYKNFNQGVDNSYSYFSPTFIPSWMKAAKLFSKATITSYRIAPRNVQQCMVYVIALFTRLSMVSSLFSSPRLQCRCLTSTQSQLS